MRCVASFLALLGLHLASPGAWGSPVWNAGAGMADITGPATGLGMMGYGRLDQKTQGIHLRLWSRAFVFDNGGATAALVVVDLCFVTQAIRQAVLHRLRQRLDGRFDERNVLITATHTHSGPGGYSHHTLYNLTTLGFSPENFEVIVSGIVRSLERAYAARGPAVLKLSQGELSGLNANRSRRAYLRNPAEERARYAGDTDTRMTVLSIERPDGTGIGAVSWFPVHNTSMKNRNRLISGDNKGYAAYLFERARGTDHHSRFPFVAAFANANAGDASPNTAGDVDGTGEWQCPLRDEFECTKDSGTRQYRKAAELFSTGVELTGPLDVRHAYVDFSDIRVGAPLTGTGRAAYTCSAAIGLSMLAGAVEDGPGFGREGITCSDLAGLFQGIACHGWFEGCHGQKPVAVRTGNKRPHPWTPQILPLQLLRLGRLALAAVPAELTTMAGRRLVSSVARELIDIGVDHVIPAGYSNAYAGYVTTREEYQEQDYEGASTHFGEWTLAAYQQELARLARAMAHGEDVAPGPTPSDLTGDIVDLSPRLPLDRLPDGARFGDVAIAPHGSYRSEQTVSVTFWGARLGHKPLVETSYLEIQHEVSGAWRPVAFDWDPETKVRYRDIGGSRGHVLIEWAIPPGAPAGTYRVLHRGVAKPARDRLVPYEGVSAPFSVE